MKDDVWIQAPGERLRVLRRLGRGGMAEVWLAERVRPGLLRKRFALKRLRVPAGCTPARRDELLGLMKQEAALGAHLRHVNVCQVHDAWSDGGEFWLLLDYLDGITFAQLTDRAAGEPGLLDVRFLTGLLVQLCAGLDHAHELRDPAGQPIGVVHRDVTPSNLFVTRGGVVKVLDFGIARSRAEAAETAPGCEGTWAYMAPECIQNRPIDRRADIFSAATVLYELLRGRRAFRRETEYLTARAVLATSVPPLSSVRLDVPTALSDAVACGMARAPGDRFATAHAFGDAIAEAMDPFGGVASITEIEQMMALVDEDGAEDAQRARRAPRQRGRSRATSVTSIAVPSTEPVPEDDDADTVIESCPRTVLASVVAG